jgi:hypothetical protein
MQTIGISTIAKQEKPMKSGSSKDINLHLKVEGKYGKYR